MHEDKTIEGRAEVGDLEGKWAIELFSRIWAFGEAKKVKAPKDEEGPKKYRDEFGDAAEPSTARFAKRNEKSKKESSEAEDNAEDRGRVLGGERQAQNEGAGGEIVPIPVGESTRGKEDGGSG